MAQAGIPVPAGGSGVSRFAMHFWPTSATHSRSSKTSPPFPHTSPTWSAFRALPDASSLVLLDELGSATDPEEGAALAVAIAGYFLDRHAWCLISTHHTSLKIYAAQTHPECSTPRWASTKRRWRRLRAAAGCSRVLRPASTLRSGWVLNPDHPQRPGPTEHPNQGYCPVPRPAA